MIFKNDNGREYFIIAGDDREALLRDMSSGSYVIARGLDWENAVWRGGSYFSKDEFEAAVKAFLDGKEENGCSQ